MHQGYWIIASCLLLHKVIHDAILFCPSQGPISDRFAFCHFAHSPSHWGLHQGRGALRWLHNLGRVQYCHQGWPKGMHCFLQILLVHDCIACITHNSSLQFTTAEQKQSYDKMQIFTAPHLSCVLFQITYYNQATPGVIPYISTDIAGLSSSFYSAFSACSHFLEANKDSLAALPPSALQHTSATMVSFQKEQ